MTDRLENARDHVRNAEGSIEQLSILHRLPADQRPAAQVAQAFDAKRDAMTLARIEALLSIAESLETLTMLLGGQLRPLGAGMVV